MGVVHNFRNIFNGFPYIIMPFKKILTLYMAENGRIIYVFFIILIASNLRKSFFLLIDLKIINFFFHTKKL